MSITNKKLILDISKRLKLSHIGSCLSVLPILESIYAKKNLEDKVLLDNAHAHLAHLVVMQSRFGQPMLEESIETFGIHCDTRAGCDASGGSLGHAGGLGIGMALANPNINVHVVFSDGSIQEGSCWEALRLRKLLKIKNMKCYFNINGFSAVAKVNIYELIDRIRSFCPDAQLRVTSNGYRFGGVQGHYKQI